MNTTARRLLFGAVILSATACFTANVPAVTSDASVVPVAASSDAVMATPMQAEFASAIGLLRGAYGTLAVADHDYKGHRVRAMKAIDAACKLMGTDITGEGRGREPQTLSDAQLRAALSQVQQAIGLIPPGKPQKRVVNHLDEAVTQLNIALTIK